jgi:hypothetical protein
VFQVAHSASNFATLPRKNVNAATRLQFAHKKFPKGNDSGVYQFVELARRQVNLVVTRLAVSPKATIAIPHG